MSSVIPLHREDEPGAAKSLRLLLIEDDAGDARRLQEALREALGGALDLEHAWSLPDGLHRLKAWPPHIILLDLSLPETPGLDALKTVLAAPGQAPVIVLTGLEDARSAAGAIRAGAADYLVKGRADAFWLGRTIHHCLERRRAEAARHARTERYRTIVESASEGILTLDADGRATFANARLGELLGLDPGEIVGIEAAGSFAEEDGELLREALRRSTSDRHVEEELELRGAAGPVSVHVSVTALRDGAGGAGGWVLLLTDITARKNFEREVERLALYDSLTGLPNRTLFESRITHALKRRTRMSHPLAVILLDLDRFKVINDTLGHPVGDVLLGMVAQRLTAVLRAEDTAARLGGDEFAILLEQIPSVEAAEDVAERVASIFEKPFEIMDTPVHVTASLGVALGGGGSQGADDLLRFCDIAMYRAKEKPGTRREIFDPSRDFGATRRLHLENELRRGIEERQLRVHYQPIVELESGRIIGAEALVRWAHPTRGFIFPVEFIALAEETGLIIDLGRWVMGEACRDAVSWSERYDLGADFLLSLNVSATQLQQPDMADEVASVLAKRGLDASRLQLEITESQAVKVMNRLPDFREKGIKLAIDDIGKGYSSLEYLARMEVDAMKIDRTFVSGLGSSLRDAAVVEAVLLLADRIGVTVVAEGIETADQLGRLRDLGCPVGQGFYFSKAVEPDALEKLLERGSYDLPATQGLKAG